ncbi:hypothetical protein [Mycobacterium deserti]|uniref:DUF3829 domain-containing protein n=1 Tax=Mycobacterium deserti TaxID=2978347 RepID=A0ABT2MJF6_9MYCO|nr:hypothetical protein [Mycobacterium deserti]MCT7661230.1 hypothetical protein [Mycobacterium deserti]
MKHTTNLLGILAACIIAVSACGTAPPELPPDSPPAMSQLLASDEADDVLNRLTTYAWDDDGAAAATRFTWIGADAHATEAGAASQANQAAAVLAEFLLTHHNNLTAIKSGFLGSSKVTAAQLNPLLIRSYATALAPYIKDLAGGQDAAFQAPRTQVSDDPSALRGLLSVLVADPEAGRLIAESVQSAAEMYEDYAASAASDSDESVTDLRAAGSLLGAVAGAARQTGAEIPVSTGGEALNDMAVRTASTLLRSDPNPGEVGKYVRGGKLMPPAEVEREFSKNAMRTYFLDLQEYLSDRGFGDGLSAFNNAFRTSSGEDVQ